MKRVILVFLAIMLVGSAGAMATSGWKNTFNGLYNTGGTRLDVCSTCHTSVPALNPYGDDMKTKNDQGSNRTESMQLIEDDDSDNDGATNIVEILNLTFPGDPNDTVPTEHTTWGKIKAIYE